MGIRKGGVTHRVTTARLGHSVSLASREKRYALSMGIRTACFIAALFVVDHWYVWIFVAAAVFLPYMAVILANAGSTPDPDPLPPVPRHELKENAE